MRRQTWLLCRYEILGGVPTSLAQNSATGKTNRGDFRGDKEKDIVWSQLGFLRKTDKIKIWQMS